MNDEMIAICGIAMIAPDHPQAYDAKFLAERIERFRHFVYRVDELQAAIDYDVAHPREWGPSTTFVVPGMTL